MLGWPEALSSLLCGSQPCTQGHRIPSSPVFSSEASHQEASPTSLWGTCAPVQEGTKNTPTPAGLVGSQGWEGAGGWSTPSGLEPLYPIVPPKITCIPHPHAGDDSFTPGTRCDLRPTSLSGQPALPSHTGSVCPHTSEKNCISSSPPTSVQSVFLHRKSAEALLLMSPVNL